LLRNAESESGRAQSGKLNCPEIHLEGDDKEEDDDDEESDDGYSE